MKLFIAPGACSLPPHIVLRELGLPFELEAVDLRAKKTRSGGDFQAVNLKGYVPALQLDDGKVLTEGVAITQFLADNFAPGKLAPVSRTVERAVLNGHLNFLSAELHKAVGPLFNLNLSPADRYAALVKAADKLDIMEEALADGRAYLGGEQFGIADAYLYVISSWSPHLGIDLKKWPAIEALSMRVAQRASVQAALAAEADLRAAA